jgi:hypothetical protein
MLKALDWSRKIYDANPSEDTDEKLGNVNITYQKNTYIF